MPAWGGPRISRTFFCRLDGEAEQFWLEAQEALHELLQQGRLTDALRADEHQGFAAGPQDLRTLAPDGCDSCFYRIQEEGCAVDCAGALWHGSRLWFGLRTSPASWAALRHRHRASR